MSEVEGFEHISLLESTVELKDDIVPLEAIAIVLVDSLDEEL